MFKRLIAPALAALFALAAPVMAQAPEASPAERQRIEAIVREYLLRNPEILQEALVELEKRQAQAEDRARAAAFAANRDALYRSRRTRSCSATRRVTSPWSSSSITTAASASARCPR